MKANFEWNDYEILASGNGEKLERWKDIYLLRPDPQAIWEASSDLDKNKLIHAKYNRVGGGGAWQYLKEMPSSWQISWRNLKFLVKPMGFKHTGIFPEQAVNWASMIELVKNANRKVKVLNLFAYTGGATVALTSAGAIVTHVDSAKNMVEIAKENMKLSHLEDKPVRYIVDDCVKFVEREIRRGNKYDAILMDPPSYGRGVNGEVWKLEDNIFNLVKLCKKILSDNPLFFLINSYTTGLQPLVIKNILYKALEIDELDNIDAYEVALPTKENIFLPCGCSALWVNK